jgi:polyhydroxyalkanoate synthase
MSKISGDAVIENIKKAGIYYQEIIMQLAQNNSLPPMPADLYNTDKSTEIVSKLFEQIFEHPEQDTDINLEYIHNLQKLIADSVAKFTGKNQMISKISLLLIKGSEDPAWQQSIYFAFIKKYYMISADWIKKTVGQYELDSDEKRLLEFINQTIYRCAFSFKFCF